MYWSIGFFILEYEGNEFEGCGLDELIDVDIIDIEENNVL